MRIFVPSKGLRSYNVLQRLPDAYAVLDKSEVKKYRTRFKNGILAVNDCSIQRKRNAILKYARKNGINEIIILDDDVVNPSFDKLIDFARKHDLVWAAYSDRTVINQFSQPAAVQYFRPSDVPFFREENVHEDLCMMFTLKKLKKRFGLLTQKVNYAYEMGGPDSLVQDYYSRTVNTHELFPEYVTEEGILIEQYS